MNKTVYICQYCQKKIKDDQIARHVEGGLYAHVECYIRQHTTKKLDK